MLKQPLYIPLPPPEHILYTGNLSNISKVFNGSIIGLNSLFSYLYICINGYQSATVIEEIFSEAFFFLYSFTFAFPYSPITQQSLNGDVTHFFSSENVGSSSTCCRSIRS